MASLGSLDTLLANLNPPQREAVTHQSRALLVFAGAGSGKTRVLTYRIAYLLLSGGCTPEQILAVTFTNKAAGEMKERVCAMLGPQGDRVWVSTFHSACLRILRGHIHHLGRRGDFVIYDEDDQTGLMKRILKDAGVGTHAYPARTILKEIDRAKGRGIGPNEFRPDEFNPYQKKAAVFYHRYEESLASFNALDFGDLLYLTHRLFQQVPSVREAFQRRFSHVLVDEYQDTNVIQHLLIRDLLGPHTSLCVVGDDDQSIYRWRGAEPANILSFERDFPDATVIKLEQNYRSTQSILKGANTVVSRNRWRKTKTLWTSNDPGPPITFFAAHDEEEEAQWVASRIMFEGPPYSRCAVFYRINAQSRALEEALIRHGIPYALVGGVRFYQRKEIKDLIAYLRLMINPSDDIGLRRILNVPPRGIGATTIRLIEEYARAHSLSLFSALRTSCDRDEVLSPGPRKRARACLSLLEGLREAAPTLSLPELTELVVERTRYPEYLLEQGEEGLSRLENVQELLSMVQDLHTARLEEFLDHVALLTDVDDYNQTANRVTLMTLHSAKGLEFPTVFMVGMEEGVLPYYLRLDNPDDLEEERRLCYVGMTRARERLYMTCAIARRLFGGQQRRMPSRFIRDLPREITVHDGRSIPVASSSWAWEEGLLSGDLSYDYDYD